MYISFKRNFNFLPILVSVAVQAGLNFTLLQNPEDRFSSVEAN